MSVAKVCLQLVFSNMKCMKDPFLQDPSQYWVVSLFCFSNLVHLDMLL